MAGRTTQSTSTPETKIADLPPSAKLVIKTLEYDGDLTQEQLTEATRLPGRTVRHALTELADRGVVTSRISLMDARQRIYTLSTDSSRRDE